MNIIGASLPSLRCRHAVFSKYFGDSPPPCKNRCDVCKNKDEVRARILQFEMCQTRSRKSRGNLGGTMRMDYDDGDNDRMYVEITLEFVRIFQVVVK